MRTACDSRQPRKCGERHAAGWVVEQEAEMALHIVLRFAAKIGVLMRTLRLPGDQVMREDPSAA